MCIRCNININFYLFLIFFIIRYFWLFWILRFLWNTNKDSFIDREQTLYDDSVSESNGIRYFYFLSRHPVCWYRVARSCGCGLSSKAFPCVSNIDSSKSCAAQQRRTLENDRLWNLSRCMRDCISIKRQQNLE